MPRWLLSSYAGLVQGTDGKFYGTTFEGGNNTYCVLGCGTVFKITSGGVLTTLYSFGSLSRTMLTAIIHTAG